MYSPLVALRSAPLLSVAEKQAQILDTDWVNHSHIFRYFQEGLEPQNHWIEGLVMGYFSLLPEIRRKLEERKQEMSQKIRSYAVLRNRILEKMRTRDPLFKAEKAGASTACCGIPRKGCQVHTMPLQI